MSEEIDIANPQHELFRTRGESLRATKQRKLDTMFRGRKWEILQEIHLPDEPDANGDYPRFENPFGNKARHGYVIRDVVSGQVVYVGNSLLKIIATRYEGVVLPVRRRGRPPKNRPAPAQ